MLGSGYGPSLPQTPTQTGIQNYKIYFFNKATNLHGVPLQSLNRSLLAPIWSFTPNLSPKFDREPVKS